MLNGFSSGTEIQMIIRASFREVGTFAPALNLQVKSILPILVNLVTTSI